MVNDPVIDTGHLPRHIAIIMDGNGRWAQGRNQPRLFGHKAGAGSVREIVEVCREIGIEVLTLYAFSSENWNRPEQEVSGLMSILKNYLIAELNRMLDNGIRLRCIGDIAQLPDEPRTTLLDSMERTAGNSDMTLNLALSYGGRDEMTRAIRKIGEDCRSGRLDPQAITEDDITSRLDTAGLPEPDLLIRTGGEARLSNFLLWQASYAEIYFTEIMWPDFRRVQFLNAINEFQQRERRFGKTSAQVAAR